MNPSAEDLARCGEPPRGGAADRRLGVRRDAAAVLVVLLALGYAAGAVPPALAAANDDLGARSRAIDVSQDEQVIEGLRRADTASREVPHAGSLTVVAFTGAGPRIAELEVRRGAGSLRLTDDDGLEFGRSAGDAFLRSSDRLLRVGGVERVPAQLDRLTEKYAGALGAVVELDTGPAVPVTLTERASEVRREVVYLDVATDLVVRRETYDTTGAPVRVVAYTQLEVRESELVVPAADGLALEEHTAGPVDVVALRDGGFEIPAELPRGFVLLSTTASTTAANATTLHSVYGDGLYSLSVFQQQGRMHPAAVEGAEELRTPDGGAVWRWPGSEPRRMVWSGGGATFTALTDAPSDEALSALAGLPVDPPPSTLSRLRRGFERMGAWLGGGGRSAGSADAPTVAH